ncbi:PilZ domain-containing protein [Marinobacter sp. F4216]|nr:PilZ domain-containing protein [Marinobacter sp. F4216]MBZ2169999.1 PilZ domain-containing protein [Marinobacter sp. F4216]
MNARVKVVHPEFDEFASTTRAISDGGVFIVVEEQDVESWIRYSVTVQVQGLPIPVPVVSMELVRRTNDGYGLTLSDG